MKVTGRSQVFIMAYQLSDLRTTIKARAKDTDLSNTLIDDYLNATQNEVLGRRRFTFMETTDTDTLSSGSTEIELEGEVQIIDYLALTVNGTPIELSYVPHRSFYQGVGSATTTAGQPNTFTFYGRTIIFNCPADQSYTVTLHYTRRPSQLENDSDVPDIPLDYKELLIRGALAGVEEYRENFEIGGVHRRKVEELAEDMNLRYGLRQLITAPRQTRRSFRRAAL